jgi:hypothetical protein
MPPATLNRTTQHTVRDENHWKLSYKIPHVGIFRRPSYCFNLNNASIAKLFRLKDYLGVWNSTRQYYGYENVTDRMMPGIANHAGVITGHDGRAPRSVRSVTFEDRSGASAQAIWPVLKNLSLLQGTAGEWRA